MSTFDDILNPLSSSNGTCWGTDKNTTHSYGAVYNDLFAPFRKDPIDLLEIGFDCGASLVAYSRFFENARIFGIDIVNRMTFGRDNDRIQVHIGDATLPKNVNHFNREFDIIIEDASHRPNHQIQHFYDFGPLIKAGGIYVIEDVANLEAIELPIRQKAVELGFSFEIVDLRGLKKRYDDMLIVLRKI